MCFPYSFSQFQPLDLSLSHDEKSICSSGDSDTGFARNTVCDFTNERISDSDSDLPFITYSAQKIRRIVLDLENEMKNKYVQPVSVPVQHKNMVRDFDIVVQSMEERERRDTQANSARISRDKLKFFRERMKEEIELLHSVLHDHIKRLMNLECYANELLMINGQRPIDWRHIWNDDACGARGTHKIDHDDVDDNNRTDYVSGSECGESVGVVHTPDQMIANDQQMIDWDESVSANDDATFYESHSGARFK